jgi:hypothetical protein
MSDVTPNVVLADGSSNTVETDTEIAQYKLAITTRISELESGLNNDLHNQVGLLMNSRYLAEYMMYYLHIYRNKDELGFSSAEILYYAKRLNQYMGIFNDSFGGDNTEFECLNLDCFDSDDNVKSSKIKDKCVSNLQSKLLNYYQKILSEYKSKMPTSDQEKELYLKSNSQILEELYKCILIYQNVPNTISNLTPMLKDATSRKRFSIDGTGDASSENNYVKQIVKDNEELLQYGKTVSQKNDNDTLDVDLSKDPIENFTNIEVDTNGEYLFPEEVTLNQSYLAMLACSSIYTPFVSYAGCSEFTNSLYALADTDEQATNLVQLYNSVKDYRKPLYKRTVSSDGSVTGPATLITIEDFINDIQNGTAGALVTVQGDFHYNSEAQSWIYSQNELTYDYSLGTTVIDSNSSSSDSTNTEATTESTTENNSTSSISENNLNVFTATTVSATNTTTEATTEASSAVSSIVDITSTTTMAKTLNNIIFVGDSRTVQLKDALVSTSTDVTAKSLENNNVYFVAEDGKGYDWFNDTAKSKVTKILKNNSGVKFTIIINLGVNDLSNVKKYYKKYNALAKDAWKNANVVVESVGLVDETKEASNGYSVKNTDINSFNVAMQSNLAQNVTFVDVSSAMLDSTGNSLLSEYATTDGVHYSNSVSLKLCMNTVMECVDTNKNNTTTGNNGSENSSTEENTSTESATNDTELVSDDLSNAVYAYDTITDETYLTQPIVFYGTKYSRAIDNTTTAILQNVINDSASVDSLENKGSRYLYVNMFGDVVTDDNLVILPGYCNPLIYSSNISYNPYTVTFMNYYPVLTNRGLYFQVSTNKSIGKYVLMSSSLSEDITNATLRWTLITGNSTVSSTNLKQSVNLEDTFYTNTVDENVIMSSQRCVFGSVANWITSPLYDYNVVMQTYKPTINESLLFPYSSADDLNYELANVITKNAYEYIAYSRTEYAYKNNNSLNDNYLAHNFIISGRFGNKNPKGFAEDRSLEYSNYLESKKDQIEEQVVNLSEKLVDNLTQVNGTLGLESSYKSTILGRFIQIGREYFWVILICSLLILLVAFLKFHRDLFEIGVLTMVAALIITLGVYYLPIYLPMAYNFIVDNTSTSTAFKVLGVNSDENSTLDASLIQLDEDGNYKYNTSSVTLYKVDPLHLSEFYDNLAIDATDVMYGNTSILNQEAGVYVEGDSIKVNTAILFDTLPITGKYTTVSGTYCWQIEATKTVSNNVDYYTPYYYFVDGFIEKLNLLSQVYDLSRCTNVYSNGSIKDNYLVYSYVNSNAFLSPGDYDIVLQEDAEDYMSDYASFISDSVTLSNYMEAAFGTNSDWLGVANVFTGLTEDDKASLWAQTLQENGYYDSDWVPNEEKLTKLINYINNQTRNFVYDMSDEIGAVSDETMIKLIALRATIAFSTEASQFGHWIYPSSIDYSDLTLGDVLGATFVKDYETYVIADVSLAEYIDNAHGWFVLIIFDLLVVVAFLITNIVKVMIPVLYLLLLIVLFARFLQLGDLKIPVRGYLKTSVSLFVAFTLFNLTFNLVGNFSGSTWGIFLCLFMDIIVLYVICNTIIAVLMNVMDFGDREFSAKLTAVSDKLKLGDVFNQIRFNVNKSTHNGNNSSRLTRNKTKSKYSFDSSVDSVYNDRSLH